MLYSNKYGKNMLKFLLFQEITKLTKLDDETKFLNTQIKILKSIIDELTTIKDYESLYEASELFSLQLSIVFDEITANAISDKLRSILLELKKLSKNSESYEQEFNKCQNDLLIEVKKLVSNLQTLKNKYEVENKNDYVSKIIEYRRIISNLKYEKYITEEQYKIIDEFIKTNEFNEKEQIKILENVRNHNLYIKFEQENIKSTEADRKEILNMLDLGYEKFPDIYIENLNSKKRIDAIADSLCDILQRDDADMNIIMSKLPDLTSGEYSYEEFSAIFIKILKYLQEQLKFDADAISTREYYDDLVMRDTVKREYIIFKQKYNAIREYYDTQIDNYENKIENVTLEEEVNNVFYVNNDSDSYIEKDIKKIPKEYLYKVELLIKKLKTGILSIKEKKNLTDREQLKELKDDQIRILFYHLGENNYLIVGCAVKKSDNLKRMYDNMSSRQRKIDIGDKDKFDKEKEVSRQVEERIFDYIKNNKRSGTR